MENSKAARDCTLKAVLYRSNAHDVHYKTKLPADFTSVIVKARRNNSVVDITGILFYYQGQYLHLLEGESTTVEALFEKIKTDKRHDNIEVLVNTPIKHRYLDGSPLKLANANDAINPGFYRFVKKYLDVSESVNVQTSSLLDTIFAQSLTDSENSKSQLDIKQKNKQQQEKKQKKKNVPTNRAKFNNSMLKINMWPKFDKIEPSGALIQLCAMLIKGFTPYPKLLASNVYSTEDELEKALAYLQSLSLLESNTMEAFASSHYQHKPKSGFFSKVQGFLKRLKD